MEFCETSVTPEHLSAYEYQTHHQFPISVFGITNANVPCEEAATRHALQNSLLESTFVAASF